MKLMLRIGNWKLTERGLFRLRWHGDAKTGGKKARWQEWDRIL